MRVCFETFGCRLNRAEALQHEAQYRAAGWQVVHSHSEADVIVVRGCSVTHRAQRDCEKLIASLRSRYPAKRIVVTGCLPEEEKSKAVASLPPETGEAIARSTARAYLKVQDGCNWYCSFGTVPQFRGSSVSVDSDEVLDKARRFADAGYREIVVTGCNLALYASKGRRLPELIDRIAAVSPDCRVRIGSLEPMLCAMETLNAIAAHDNICRFIHIPVQSGSNRILSAMRRPYLYRDVEQIVLEANRLMPGIAIGCDIITGFPGENEADFVLTRQMLERLPFSKAHIFPYSERPGTPAVMMANPVAREIRSARAHKLAVIMDDKRTSYAKSFVGKRVTIVIENEEECAGWTGEYLWCEVGKSNARLNAVRELTGKVVRRAQVDIVVSHSQGHRLYGNIV